MGRRWVSDTSPLIFLNKLGRLDLLIDLCDEVVIPRAVADELLHYKKEQAIWNNFFTTSKINILHESISVPPEIAAWDLGKGESEVISYSIAHPEFEAILDDSEARKCAETHGVLLRGTVGIILLAKKSNLISEAKPLIESLIRYGFRFNMDWVRDALNLVGETI